MASPNMVLSTKRQQSQPHADACMPRQTSLHQICSELQETLAPYLDGRTTTPIASERRDRLLAQARSAFSAQLYHDLDFTIHDLSRLATAVTESYGRDVRRIPVVADLFRRLEHLRRFLRVTDYLTSSQVEEQCWLATQQFFCDALELADRLLHLQQNGSTRRWPLPNRFGEIRRRNLMGITAYDWPTVLGRGAEGLAPNFWRMRFFSTLFPTLWRVLYHIAIPWGDTSWDEFERSTLTWLGRDGFVALRGHGSPDDIVFRGLERLASNPELMDLRTGRLRHNVVVCGSHRIGFLDFPFFTKALLDVPHAVWANNSFYGPGMARKLKRDPRTICIRGEGKLPIFEAIDQTIDVMKNQGVALFMMADGSQPNMMYCNQMRVKRGVRLFVDESVRRRGEHGRRTFVAPLTMDDPISYLCGADDRLVVTMHEPIEITTPSTPKPRTSHFDPDAINGGDDLLNHLEALYMCNNKLARRGFETPPVVEAARLHQKKAMTTTLFGNRLRTYLERRGPTRLFELCTSRFDS